MNEMPPKSDVKRKHVAINGTAAHNFMPLSVTDMQCNVEYIKHSIAAS